MKAAGRISTLPRLVGVQSTGCAPLVTAFKQDEWVKYVNPKTAADAIAVGYPTFGNQALANLKSCLGNAVSVSDADLRSEQKKFHGQYGLVSELAGVAGIAAIRKSGYAKGERIVSIVSGGNV
jgi:threonine synthase